MGKLDAYFELARTLVKDGFMCPTYCELNELAMRAMLDDDVKPENFLHEDAKHRRALLIHVSECKHKYCKKMRDVMGGTLEIVAQMSRYTAQRQNEREVKKLK